MAEILITVIIFAGLCLFGLLVLLVPVIFLLVFLGGVARRQRRERLMENMLEQQYLMMSLYNQQRLDSLNRFNPPSKP